MVGQCPRGHDNRKSREGVNGAPATIKVVTTGLQPWAAVQALATRKPRRRPPSTSHEPLEHSRGAEVETLGQGGFGAAINEDEEQIELDQLTERSTTMLWACTAAAAAVDATGGKGASTAATRRSRHREGVSACVREERRGERGRFDRPVRSNRAGRTRPSRV